MGSGPYTFREWVKGDHLVLTSNAQYWRGAPKIQTVTFRPIPDTNTRIAALLTGDVDFITQVPYSQIERINASAGAMVTKTQGNQSFYVGLQLTKVEALKDVRVRQALNYAVDRNAIIQRLLLNNAVPLGSPIPPLHFGYCIKVKPYTYDPAKAKQLLAEAGYSNGFSVKMSVPSTGLGEARDPGLAVISYLEAVGIKITPVLSEGGAYIQKMWARQLDDLYILFIRNPNMDAGQLYRLIIHSKGSFNFNSYANAKADGLIDEAASTFDVNKRRELYCQTGQLVHDDPPWIFLYNPQVAFGIQKSINWQARADEMIFVFDDIK
jgi:peptide/nickel transport system substrate-binding protein